MIASSAASLAALTSPIVGRVFTSAIASADNAEISLVVLAPDSPTSFSTIAFNLVVSYWLSVLVMYLFSKTAYSPATVFKEPIVAIAFTCAAVLISASLPPAT